MKHQKSACSSSQRPSDIAVLIALSLILLLQPNICLAGNITIQNDLTRTLSSPSFYFPSEKVSGIVYCPETVQPGKTETIVINNEVFLINTQNKALLSFTIAEGTSLQKTISIGWLQSLSNSADNKIGIYYGEKKSETSILDDLFVSQDGSAIKATAGWATRTLNDRTRISFFMASDVNGNIQVHLYDSNRLEEGIYYFQQNGNNLYLTVRPENPTYVFLDSGARHFKNQRGLKWKVTKNYMTSDTFTVQNVNSTATTFPWTIKRVSEIDNLFSLQNADTLNYLDSSTCRDTTTTCGLSAQSDTSTYTESLWRLTPASPEEEYSFDYLQDNYFYMVGPESRPDFKLATWWTSSAFGVEIKTSDISDRKSFWLFKKVTPAVSAYRTKTGYVIMNYPLSLFLTKVNNENKTTVTTLYNSSVVSIAEPCLAQLWDIQSKGGVYEIGYTIRNLACETGCYLDLRTQTLSLTDEPVVNVLVKSRLQWYAPFDPRSSLYVDNGKSYLISTALSSTAFTLDGDDTGNVYGRTLNGKSKQRWILVKAGLMAEPNAYYLQNAGIQEGTTQPDKFWCLTVIETSSINTVNVTASPVLTNNELWIVTLDEGSYNLFYTIRSYAYPTLYLTSAETKANGNFFTLEKNSARPQDQRFKTWLYHEEANPLVDLY